MIIRNFVLTKSPDFNKEKRMDLTPWCNNKNPGLQFVIVSDALGAFIGLGSCDNVQTKRSSFVYANWPRL